MKLIIIALIIFALAVLMTMTGRGGGNFYVLTLVKDKAFIAECTAELITSSGQTGKRYVPDPNAEKIYGTDDAPFILDCEFPFEFVETPPQLLTTQKTDAAIFRGRRAHAAQAAGHDQVRRYRTRARHDGR